MASVAAGPAIRGRAGGIRPQGDRPRRGWSTRDAFIYAAFSINLITLGLYIFGYAPFIPGGSLICAVLIGGRLSGRPGHHLCIADRGDAARRWRLRVDSRVLGGGIGFVLAVTGWWFILWLWVPIYANILNVEVLGPMAAIVGWSGAVDFLGRTTGSSPRPSPTRSLASGFIALGMRGVRQGAEVLLLRRPGRARRDVLLLLFNSKASFITHFNDQSKDLYGVDNAYAATLKAGLKDYTRARAGLARPRRHARC